MSPKVIQTQCMCRYSRDIQKLPMGLRERAVFELFCNSRIISNQGHSDSDLTERSDKHLCACVEYLISKILTVLLLDKIHKVCCVDEVEISHD